MAAPHLRTPSLFVVLQVRRRKGGDEDVLFKTTPMKRRDA